MRKAGENAHAGIAVPARAVETGAASRQTTTSTNDFNTSPPERQPLQISDYLQRGQQNAVALKELVQWTGFPGRDLRRRIEAERRQGVPILSDNIGGYYLPGDSGEVDRCVRSLRRRASEILETAAAIENAMEEAANG